MESIEILLGVVIKLGWDGEIIEIEPNKEKIKKRKKLMSFVGIAKDSKDTSLEHNKYINESIL